MKKPYELIRIKKLFRASGCLPTSHENSSQRSNLGRKCRCCIVSQTIDELLFILKILKDVEILMRIIGNGSNIIVTDGGIEGAVINTDAVKRDHVKENTIFSLAGNL